MSEFEKWFTGEEDTKTRRAIMEKDDAGYYKFQSAYNAFLAWQAATAVSDKRIAELEAHINVLHEALGKAMNDEAGWYEIAKQTLSATPAQSLLQHDNEVIDRCAKVCEKDYLTYMSTEEAHYRLSPEQFIPSNFGFNMDIINKSKCDAEAIRALKHTS